jgi:16S rRNA (uracil1498-N3)-methyltransferase
VIRIFVAPEELVAGEIVVRGDEHHYLGRVRRAAVGVRVEVVDGGGRRADATIAAMTGDRTTLSAADITTAVEAGPRIRVLLPLIKGDRMDYALEKLVEVGVDEIVLWPATHAVVRLAADKLAARLVKYAAQLQAAARQCRRATVPTVTAADSLPAALRSLPAGHRFVLDPDATARLTCGGAIDVTLVGGPEGGLSSDELATLHASDFTSICLGPRTLRAETAPVIAVALARA